MPRFPTGTTSSAPRPGARACLTALLLILAPAVAESQGPVPAPVVGPFAQPELAGVLLDQPYGTAPWEVYDFYPGVGPAPRPLIVHVHAGGYQNGDKSDFKPFEFPNDLLLSNGFSVAAIRYGSSTPGKYAVEPQLHPVQSDSIAKAVAFFRTAGARVGVQPENVFLWSGSSGATLCALVAYDGATPAISRPKGMVLQKPLGNYMDFQQGQTFASKYFTGDTTTPLSDVPLVLQEDASPLFQLQQPGGVAVPTYFDYSSFPTAPPLLDYHDSYSGFSFMLALQAKGDTCSQLRLPATKPDEVFRWMRMVMKKP